MKKFITAYPYAVQTGYIDIPDHIKEEDQRQYVLDHFDEIEFGEPDLDYVGTDLEIG